MDNDVYIQSIKRYQPDEAVYLCFFHLLTNLAILKCQFQKELWFLEKYSHSPFILETIRQQEHRAMIECIHLSERG